MKRVHRRQVALVYEGGQMGLDRCGCLGHRAFVGQLVWYCLPTCVSESRAETSNVDEVLKQGPIFVKQHAQRVNSS